MEQQQQCGFQLSETVPMRTCTHVHAGNIPLHNLFNLEWLVPGCLQAALLPRAEAHHRQQYPSIPPLSVADSFSSSASKVSPMAVYGQKNPLQPSCFALFVCTLQQSQNQKVNSIHIPVCQGLFAVVVRNGHTYWTNRNWLTLLKVQWTSCSHEVQ